MERRSLCETYTKYLLCKDITAEARGIQRRLFRLGLLPPTEDTIEDLRSELILPPKFFPDTLRHKPSVRFLEEQGLLGLFHPDKFDKQALDILHRARVKEAVESWVLTDANGVQTSEFLKSAMKAHYAPEAIERYLWFCFNRMPLVDSEVADMLQSYHRRWCNGNHEQDPRYIAAMGGNDEHSRLYLREVLGCPVESRDLPTRLHGAVNVLVTVVNSRISGSRNAKPQDLRDYSATLATAQVIVSNMSTASQDVAKQVDMLAMKKSDIKTRLLSDISGGNHNVEVVSGEKDGYNSEPIDAEFVSE